MNVIGAMRSFFRNVFRNGGQTHGSGPDTLPIGGLSVLRAQFAFGLEPMRGLVAVRPPGLFPNLMGPTSNVFVVD